MESTRSYTMMPEFEYNGIIMTAFLYTKGNSDLIHSWDVVTRGYNLSKSAAARAKLAITDEDMARLNARVASYVRFKQGIR